MSPFTLAACAAFFWGLSTTIEKWGLTMGDPRAGVVFRSIGVGLGTCVFLLIQPKVLTGVVEMPWRGRAALICGGALASVVAQIFFYRALKAGDVGRVAAVGGSWPVVTFLFSLAFLGESVSLQKAAGVVLVVLGAALLR